jgi:type IV pilus assembly protein PilP
MKMIDTLLPITLLPLLLLSGCRGPDDIDHYVAQINTNGRAVIEPLPTITAFSPMSYQQPDTRSPFMAPQPEVNNAKHNVTTLTHCAAIVANRHKALLERYSLTSLEMQGTIGKAKQLWALIGTPDGQLVRVGLNHYVGLDQGRITAITNTRIDLIETVPDGNGCWVTRNTQLLMATPDEQR